jgi:hypothetical protein
MKQEQPVCNGGGTTTTTTTTTGPSDGLPCRLLYDWTWGVEGWQMTLCMKLFQFLDVVVDCCLKLLLSTLARIQMIKNMFDIQIV